MSPGLRWKSVRAGRAGTLMLEAPRARAASPQSLTWVCMSFQPSRLDDRAPAVLQETGGRGRVTCSKPHNTEGVPLDLDSGLPRHWAQ